MNINTSLYIIFENIKFNNIGYLNIGFYYSIKIYNITTLINNRFNSNSTTTANNRNRSGSGRIINIKIIFNELIIIFENFNKIANGLELFNKNIILKLRALNTESVTDTQNNFYT